MNASEEFCRNLYKEDPTDPASGWTMKNNLVDDNKGYTATVYTKSCPGYAINWTRTHCRMKKCSAAAFDKMMMDIENQQKEDNPNMIKFEVYERHPNNLLKKAYVSSKMPMFMSNRDHCFEFKVIEEAERKIYVTVSIDDDKYPVTDDFVRMKIFKYSTIREDGEDLLFEDIANFNMGGYVPSSLMNMMLGSLMAKGMSKFKDKLDKMQATVA